MSSLPHFYRIFRLPTGPRMPCLIALHHADGSPYSKPVYAAPGTEDIGSQWFSTSGIVDFYLKHPDIVDVRISPLGPEVVDTEVVWSDQWVGTEDGFHLPMVYLTQSEYDDLPAEDVDSQTLYLIHPEGEDDR